MSRYLLIYYRISFGYYLDQPSDVAIQINLLRHSDIGLTLTLLTIHKVELLIVQLQFKESVYTELERQKP